MYFFFCRLKTINKSALEELHAEPSKAMDPDYHEKARAQNPVASSSTSGGSIPRGPGSGLLWWQKANRRPPGRKKKSYYRLKPEVFDDPAPESYSRLDRRRDHDDDDDDYHRSQKSQRGGKGGKRGRPLKALTIRNIVGSPDYVPEFDEDLVAKNKKYYESTSALHRERQFIDSPPSQRYQKRKKKVRYEYNYSSSPTSDSDLDSEANRAANAILKETKTTNDEILSQYPDLEIMDDYTAQILKTLPVNDLVTLLNSVSKGSNSVLSVQSCVEENGETTIYVVEEERPKPGASTSASAQQSDAAAESSESVALTNANGEPITNVALDEDPEQLSVNYDTNNVGITVTESGGLQVTEVTEVVTPRPPPLQPAPGYLTSKRANEDRYRYKSLAGNPEPVTVVSSASLASPISTVTVAETSSREEFDQSIIQQAMETMNPSSGAEVKPLMPVIYYKCKDSNQIFSVPVTHEQAINIAAGKAEYRPDLGKVVPMNNNEASAEVKDDKSLLQPSRSATPMSSHEVRGEIDIRPLSPACSEHSVRTCASIGASSAAGVAPSAADLRRQQSQQGEKPYDLGIANDVNGDDDDDEIEIEIQTDEAGNIISTNAETLLKKVGNDDNDNANDVTENSTSSTNPVTPTTTSHIQIIPRQPILYNAAHIQHNNQDSYTSRSSISHEYNTATDYQNALTINTASAFQTIATTTQQPLLSMTHSVSTHSIGCGDDLADVVPSASTPEPKPPKESRTIAIQTSPSKDASNDDSNGDDDGTTVGIQTQTSPDFKKRRQRVVLCVSDSGPDSSDDDVIVVKPMSNPEVTKGSNSEIPTSWLVDDTVHSVYIFQVHYNEAMWQTCGISEDTDIQLLISDDSDDTANHPNPDTRHCDLFAPAKVTHGQPSSPAEEEHSVTTPIAVEHNIITNIREKSNDNNIYDYANSEVIPSGPMSATEAIHGEPSGTSVSGPEEHSITSPTSGEYNVPTNDKTEMSYENNSVLSNNPDCAINEVVINEPMEMCTADESQVADDERNALQNVSSMTTEELGAECSSTKENQSEIEKDANNRRKDAGNMGEAFESVTPTTTSFVTPLPSKLNDGADYVDVTLNDAEDDRSTSPDSVRLLPRSPVYRPRTSGIFSRKGNIKFGGTSLRIKLRAPSAKSRSKSKSYVEDIANDADAEDDEFDDDYDDDDDDDEEDDDIDPPEYPSFTRRKSKEEKVSEQQHTDDGTETEPGDEHPNSEGWESEFADNNDDGEANSQQSIPESSEISQRGTEKQVSQETEIPKTDEQCVTIGQASQIGETSQIDEQSVTVAQLSPGNATPQTDEESVTLGQASQQSPTPEMDEQCVTLGQASQESPTPEMDEQSVILEQASQESPTSEMDEQGVILEQASQESPTPEMDEQGVILEQASQESPTPVMDEQDVILEQAPQQSPTPEMDEQGVILEQASQESPTPEMDEQRVILEQAQQEDATPQNDEQTSQEAVLHLSQLASGDLDASSNDGSLDGTKPLPDEKSPESNDGQDEKKLLTKEMKTQSLPSSPMPKEISQVSWLSLMQITRVITDRN